MTAALIPLNILIGDRTYRIKSLAKDEEVIRKNLKIINDKIIEFKTQFAGKDMQDYVSMVLIWYATQAKETDFTLQNEGLLESLQKIEKQIDEAI